MPFHYILANLLANNERAVGALFLDDRGETVDFACAEFSPYEMKVAGAYLRIYLKNLERVLAAGALGEPQLLHIERDGIHLHVMALPDGYCLALLQRPPALVGQARKTLTRAVEEIKAEAFG
jgi:hypothetical protein